jgi:hypothetical protein
MPANTSMNSNRQEIVAAVARYLRIGEGRPESAAPKPVARRSKAVRPKQAASNPARKLPRSKLLRCYDCGGEIEATWEQCPHCALMLDPVAA